MSSNRNTHDARPAAKIFRAIFWKELREGARWGAAGLLITAGIWAYLLRQLSSFSEAFVSSMFTMTPVAAALVGLVIGLAQMIPENRSDSWGFLAHRPATRTCLFVSKAAAGVLLFVIAFDIPIVAMLAWIATPGRAPYPFDWRLAAPAVVDTLSGLAYYFAGLMTGIRHGRWYGSRALGLGGALVVSAAASATHGFSQALLITGIGLFILAMAAWSHFVAGGAYRPQPLAGRWATGVVLGTGLTLALVIIACFAIVLFIPRAEYPANVPSYTVAANGAVVQKVNQDDGTLAINDIEGRPLQKLSDREAIDKLSAGVVGSEAYVGPEWKRYMGLGGYRTSTAFFETLSEYPDTRFFWYYVHRARLIAVYDRRSRQLVGWMGPDGFTAGQSQPERRFEGPLVPGRYYNPWILLAFPREVYRLDMNERRIQRIFTAPSGETIVGTSQGHPNDAQLLVYGDRAHFDLIITDRKVYVQSRAGVQRLAADRDPLAQGYGTVSVYQPLQAEREMTYVWYLPAMGSIPVNEWISRPDQVTAFGPDGELIAHYTIPPSRLLLEPQRWPPAFVLSLVQPLAILAAQPALGWGSEELGPLAVNGAPPSTIRTISWWITLAMSAVSAIVAFLRSRAHAFSTGRVWLWTTLAFLLGPVGVGLLLALEGWPAREPCSACGRRRVVTRDHCEHCGAPCPPPSGDGTEIFETAV
jgi:hypothetical protein